MLGRSVIAWRDVDSANANQPSQPTGEFTPYDNAAMEFENAAVLCAGRAAGTVTGGHVPAIPLARGQRDGGGRTGWPGVDHEHAGSDVGNSELVVSRAA